MKQTLSFIFAIVLLVTTACKKKTQCPEAFTENTCEEYKDRQYPNLDISQEPAAWYRATVEGQETTVGTGYEDMGFTYKGIAISKTTTPDPILIPGQYASTNFYFMNFGIDAPSKELVGKSYAILSFMSPYFQIDTIDNPVAFATSLFAPGVKQVNDGTNSEKCWNIQLMVLKNIEREGQTWSSGLRLTTEAAGRSHALNYFEITKSTSEDLGATVRFTIWCSFSAEMYSGMGDGTLGLYFGPVEQGTAKLYVDVAK